MHAAALEKMLEQRDTAGVHERKIKRRKWSVCAALVLCFTSLLQIGSRQSHAASNIFP